MIENDIAVVASACVGSVGDDRIHENSQDSQTTVWSSRSAVFQGPRAPQAASSQVIFQNSLSWGIGGL